MKGWGDWGAGATAGWPGCSVLKPAHTALVLDNHMSGPSLPTPTPQSPVKPNTLTLVSLISIILLPFHIAGDVVLGLDKGGSGLVFVVVPILLVLATGALLLPGRRSGYLIMFLGGLAALGMPVIHRNNGFTAAVARSPGGVFFIWTLIALGVTGGLAMILSVHGLWNLRSSKAARDAADKRVS